MILELSIERHFMARLAELGIVCVKLNLQGRRGYPDRLVLLPRGRSVFVELKVPGKDLSVLQKYIHDILRRLGHDVQTFDDADEAIEYIQTRHNV